MLQIFQTQVFQFAFEFVETQFVGKRGVEVTGFLAHLVLGILLRGVTNLPHQVDPVCNHDENHTHVFGEREQQVAEVLALDDRILLVQFTDAAKPVDDVRHALAVLAAQRVDACLSGGYDRIEHDGQYAIALQPYFGNGNVGCLQGMEHGIDAKHVALQLVVGHSLSETGIDLTVVALLQRVADSLPNLVDEGDGLSPLFRCKNKPLSHTQSSL